MDKLSFHLELIEHCLEYSDDFTEAEVKENLSLKDWEAEIFRKMCESSRSLRNGSSFHIDDTIFICTVVGNGQGQVSRYTLNLEATFKYIDYLELKEARENSRKAHNLAMWAIIISGGIGLASILLQAFDII